MIGYILAWMWWLFFKVFKRTQVFTDVDYSVDDVADDSLIPDNSLRCPKCQSDEWQTEYEGGSGRRIHCRNNHLFMYAPGFGLIE